jgi:hypothetical protein
MSKLVVAFMLFLVGAVIGSVTAIQYCISNIESRAVVYAETHQKPSTAPLKRPQVVEQACVQGCNVRPLHATVHGQLINGGY